MQSSKFFLGLVPEILVYSLRFHHSDSMFCVCFCGFFGSIKCFLWHIGSCVVIIFSRPRWPHHSSLMARVFIFTCFRIILWSVGFFLNVVRSKKELLCFLHIPPTHQSEDIFLPLLNLRLRLRFHLSLPNNHQFPPIF